MIEINLISNVFDYITDSLTQWDSNQSLKIAGIVFKTTPVIHFANKKSDKALVIKPEIVGSVLTVPIPNSLLRDQHDIIAYIYVFDGDSGKTVYTIRIPIESRTQPDDFVFSGDDGFITLALLNSKVDTMISEKTIEINKLISTKTTEINTLVTNKTNEINTLINTKTVALNDLKTAKETELNNLKLAKETELNSLKTTKDTEFNTLKASIESKFTALQNSIELTFSDLETAKTEEIDALISAKTEEIDDQISAKINQFNTLITTKTSELNTLISSKSTELANLLSTKTTELTTLVSTKTTELNTLKTNKTTEINSLISTKTTELDTLKSNKASDLDTLKTTKTKEIDDLIALKTDEINRLNPSGRNLIINGDFQVWQRGTSFLGGTNLQVYTADRWWIFSTNTTYKVEKHDKGLKVSSSTTSVGLYYTLDYPLIIGEQYTLSAKIDGAIKTVNIVGGTTILENGIGYRYEANKPRIELIFEVGEHIVEWVKLEQSPIATLHVPRPYAEDLALCQRYYISMTAITLFGIPVTGSQAVILVSLPSFMRITPKCNLIGTLTAEIPGKFSANVTLISLNRYGGNTVELLGTLSVDATAYYGNVMRIYSATAGITLDAEIY